MEGYRNNFAGLLCFFLHNLCWVSSQGGKKENRKKKTENKKKKTKNQQCGFERVRPTNARISKSN